MQKNFRFIGYMLVSFMLISCVSTEKIDSIVIEPQPGISGNYKFEAWRPNTTGEFVAINALLDQADVLIENNAFEVATDKLERALRIKPQYAPTWSRLSWLALASGAPERSVQMAKRSNSFAFSSPQLQSLNWSFIRSASEILLDDATFDRANQAMEALKTF
ncbi:MAG: hypothetical protein COB77_04365 [Gammaproteobacteria bacterium]|nr:MAG: hypothetical protein COB77_04365 [Gammaproteobacteria bacterium]